MFQGGYQPQQWQQGFNQAPQRTGPPPAKKAKGNPIITRYPPPPGYRGPAQPQFPYQQQPHQQPQSWQQPGQPYTYGQTSYPGYPQQSYGVPQSYQQPFTQGYPNAQLPYQQMQYSPASYAPQTQYPPPAHAQTYPMPQAPNWQPQHLTPQSAPVLTGPPQDWAASSTIPQKRRHHSTHSIDQSLLSFDPVTEHSETSEDLGDDDFTGECYFASHPDEIDEDFSLGWISWKAALPTKRALPSTWAEAELEALAPRKPLPTDDESISDYFIKARRHEALLSIRLTDYWTEMKDDHLFKELPAVCSEIMSMPQLLAKYKDRPDPAWSARPFTPTPEPEIVPSGDAVSGANENDERDLDARRGSLRSTDENEDVLGNLEQALQQNGAAHSRRHSRASSVASTSSQKLTRPTPLMPIRDQAQEDILASLGVTGSPKMIYQTPGPAFGAPSHQRQGSTADIARHNSATSNHEGAQVPPPPLPPPPPPGHPPGYYDSRRRYSRGYNSDRRGSNASHQTATGSDFNGDDNDATPRPKVSKNDSRKRGYTSESDSQDERRRQDDDETPRQRRKQARTDDPWSARRW